MTEVLESLQYLTDIVTNEFGEMFANQQCYQCGIIHKPEPDACCTQCNENYCMKSWCIDDYEELAEQNLLHECLNSNNEYEFRCSNHTNECIKCSIQTTTEVCIICSYTIYKKLSKAADIIGFRLKKKNKIK